MTDDLAALAERVAQLEMQQQRARNAARAFAALTPAQRRALIEERAAATPGDNLRYPDDYNDWADSPAALQMLAEDVQVGLNKRATSSVVNYMHHLSDTVKHTSWDGYATITDTAPTPLGYYAYCSRGAAGIWHVTCLTYCDVTGGSGSEQGMGCGIAAEWADNFSTAQWKGGMQATIGRVTAPRNGRLVVAQVSEGYITHRPGVSLRLAPAAWVYGSVVAGGAVKAGESRMTIEWLSNITAVNVGFTT